jgi:hypothetical protein
MNFIKTVCYVFTMPLAESPAFQKFLFLALEAPTLGGRRASLKFKGLKGRQRHL